MTTHDWTASIVSHRGEDKVRSAREPWINFSNIFTIARKEIRDSLRNRWFILYSIAFGVLALALAYMSLAGTGHYGFGGFGRTSASLINLVMLIVPLMALTAGAGSIAGERDRGTLGYLLAQPVSTFEILMGKYIGLAMAMFASLALGFGLSAGVIAANAATGGSNAGAFLQLVGLAFALSLCMLSIGFLISALARSAGVAIAIALFVWLALVFVGDLGLMGSALAFKLKIQQLFGLSLINPLQVFKMASLSSIHASLDVLGPAGLYATQRFGESLAFVFIAALVAWIVVPLAAAQALFAWRGAS